MTLEDQAIKVLDESASDSESNIVDELVKEFPTLAASLVKTINKRNKTNLEIPKKQRISKNKILLDITSNLSKINGELIITNSRLQAQNDLLRGNLAFTSNSIGNLEYNDTLLTGKLDSVLQALKMQNEFMREKEEDQERDSIEGGAEGQRDAASSFGFDDVSKKGGGLVGNTFNWLKNLLGGVIGAKLKAMLGKYLLIPLLKKFAPGLVPFISKGGIKGALRSILPKWLRGGTPKANQLNLFNKGSDVVSNKPNMLQKGAKWLNNTPLVKNTKKLLGPHVKKVGPMIENFSKDPIGGINKFIRGKGKTEIAETLTKKTQQKITKKVVQRVALGGTSKGIGAIPLWGNIWDLASAAYRFKQGDIVGGFLSLGSAIPVAGWGVAAIDIARDAGYNPLGLPPPPGMEHGGVIQAPPILTPAEKGAVIGGSGSSDIGHIVNASRMLLDTYGVTLSDAPSNNEFPVDGSTGIVTLNPLAGSKPVREDEVKPEEKNSETKDIESKTDTSNISDISSTIENNDTNTTSVGDIDSQTTSDATSSLGAKSGDNIAFFGGKNPVEQLKFDPANPDRPNPHPPGTMLYNIWQQRLQQYNHMKEAGMISSATNVNNISNITPVTENNNISDNISVKVDPHVRTKIIYVTRTVSSGGNVISNGGEGDMQIVFKDNNQKLSRLILAS